MTNTNPRDLIQRLADELDAETGYTIHSTGDRVTHSDVVEARVYLAQPKPPSLKEQALVALHAVATGANDMREQRQDFETIRLALEQLDG
jgi:hypothetical protein